MKNTFFGLLFASLSAITNAQNHENYASVTAVKERSATVLNAGYLQDVYQGVNAQIINDLELQAANFDITKDAIYEEGIKTTYNVRLGKGKNQIRAVFDHKGVLIQAEEEYVNIILPLSLRIAIAKKYPGWVFSESTYKLNYAINKRVERYCSLTLERGKNKMRVKFEIPTDDSFSDSTRVAYGI